MDLSIIIVSYNVLPFLRQCIQSVNAACDKLNYEIIIVDNNSKDGSATYLNTIRDNQIHIVLNGENIGYGRGMNLGIQKAKGEFLLFLNPDTIISQEAISKCVDQLNSDPACGAVGVRMLDGKGEFLKESKRGFPTALSSFFKFSGLTYLFPKSKSLASYYQGHLKKEGNHKVDILTGAFLITRRSLMNKLGGFDERYFMYGEDIDLSYSIAQEGYYNYYVGETSIIHFKGESTRKESLKNTYHFYNSMLLFAKKYKANNVLFTVLLSLILICIGVVRWTKLNLMPIIRPLLRFGCYGIIFYAISKIWGSLYFEDPNYFDYQRHSMLILSYSGVMTLGYYIGKERSRQLRNLIWAIISILAIYSLLPIYLRSSRAVIVIGGALILGIEVVHQARKSWRELGYLSFWNRKREAILLGSFNECALALQGLRSQNSHNYSGIISDSIVNEPISLTDYDHLGNYLSDHQVDTLTMHMETMSIESIMRIIAKYGSRYQYLLYSSSTNSIIDSPNSNTQGTVSLVEISWAIASPMNRRAKRVVDIMVSLIFILFSPLLIWLVENKSGWILNIFQSLTGKTSWVGYNGDDLKRDQLPELRPAVLGVDHEPGQGHLENLAYARDYSFLKDIGMIINSFTALGNKVESNAKN